MLANCLGVYEKGLEILSHLRTEFLKNFKFVLSVGLGILIAMVFGSKIIIFLLNKYYLMTMFCFMGMIIGGIKPVFESVSKDFSKKNLVIFLISFFAIILLSVVEFNQNNTNNIFLYFLSGMSEAISTIVPGISGTALLMVIGTYNDIMSMFASLFDISSLLNNLIILLPFLIGLIIGVIVVSKVINYLFKKYKTSTYYAIIGFSLASIILIFLQTLGKNYSLLEVVLSLVTFLIGYIIAAKMPE